MLGMIEINLLPPEFRIQERTPLGLFLTVVVGICLVGSGVIYGINLNGDLRRQNDEKTRLEADKTRWLAERDRVTALNTKIATARRRQETIIEISQTKIMWSQKLCQMGRLLAEYPMFWIDRLTMARGSGFDTSFYMVNEDLSKVAEFREAVTNDTSFWYHFGKFEASSYRKQLNYAVPGTSAVAQTCITFSCRWPLK
jgi:hypothetical protein